MFLSLCLVTAGCSNLFFWPMKQWVQNPARLGLDYEDIILIAENGQRLHGWWLPAVGEPRGTVYFLHGNAQNASTHIMSVNWLPGRGYNVFILDYRGYGLSEGSPRLPAVLDDVQLGLDWLRHSSRLEDMPLIVLGQSLGASMTVPVLAREENAPAVQCAVLDSPFTGYREIANDAMRRSWLLWPLRPLMLPLLPGDDIDPISHVADLPMPLLFLHSRDDGIVPFKHSEALYQAATAPKSFYPLSGPHNAGFRSEAVQERVLKFLEACAAVEARNVPRSVPAAVHF